MTSSSRLVSRTALAALLAAPLLCFAHPGADPHASVGAAAAVLAGWLHPFAGADHLAAMLALGLWSGLGARPAWLAPIAFAAALVLGAALSVSGFALPGIEPMIAASLLVLGLLLAAGVALPALAGAALAALFGLFHGAAHGPAFGADGAMFAIGGMLMASALLQAAGSMLGRRLRERSAWLPRAAGAIVTLLGLAAVLGRLA